MVPTKYNMGNVPVIICFDAIYLEKTNFHVLIFFTFVNLHKLISKLNKRQKVNINTTNNSHIVCTISIKVKNLSHKEY